MGLDEKQFEALKREIKRPYNSVSNPRFDFVALAIRANPYARVVEDMGAIGEILEDTDANDDVSFGYLITTPFGKYCTRISMVGPYALIMGPVSYTHLTLPTNREV